MFRPFKWLIFIFIFCQTISGQETDEHLYNRSITLVPLYLFQSGIRIDYEHKFKDRHWLQICPQVFLNEDAGETLSDPYNEMVGIGIHVYHKIFLDKVNINKHGLYFSYGGGYNYYHFNYSRETKVSNTTRIQAYTGRIIIGFQQIFYKRIILDLYTGLGHRYSIRNHSDDMIYTQNFKNGQWDYGFTGNQLLLGLKFGFLF